MYFVILFKFLSNDDFVFPSLHSLVTNLTIWVLNYYIFIYLKNFYYNYYYYYCTIMQSVIVVVRYVGHISYQSYFGAFFIIYLFLSTIITKI